MLAARLVCLRTLPSRVFQPTFITKASPLVKNSITKNQWLVTPSREYATKTRIRTHLAMYGGLVLFSMFLLYDTQKVIKRAEITPMYGAQKYDPINSMLTIYMDTLNIFMRVATMLATGSNRKK
ncbi:growth hormone inducible transmembrane protein, isoform CRA_a [Mus musculus]|nr:growth hormone inducible transmembrane protein, isoform CRA_a [Mus musculus]